MDFNGLLSSLSHTAAVTLVKTKTRPLNVNCYIFVERFVRKGLVALSKVLIQLPSLQNEPAATNLGLQGRLCLHRHGNVLFQCKRPHLYSGLRKELKSEFDMSASFGTTFLVLVMEMGQSAPSILNKVVLL